ncbi:MAG: SPOR domain-containing protein [Treponema sp.]|nr:SPOR domain-containing protein [Treponema sp.]
MLRRAIFVFCLCVYSVAPLAAQKSARTLADEAAAKATIDESISFLRDEITAVTDAAERRSLLIFLGALQEQSGKYEAARESYVAAAAIAAKDAPHMMKRSSEQLALDAVRCALSLGDVRTAEAYLNSSIRNSRNASVQAYIKLYELWCLLCRAESSDALEEPIALLTAYSSLSSLETVRPQLLFTAWYITGESSWADQLIKRYPMTLEAGVVQGTVKLLPAPFWFFVPHAYAAVSDAHDDTASSDKTIATSANSAEAPKRLQLGLFREKHNADRLVAQAAEKGFTAYTTTETRESTTTYYIVLVNDDDGSVAPRLRSMSFECYAY